MHLVYAGIAFIALIGCWSQNLYYFTDGLLAGGLHFIRDLTTTPASRSISIDLFLFFLSASIWMVWEGKRLKIKYFWIYIVLGAFIAISVTFPLFLIHRQIALDREG